MEQTKIIFKEEQGVPPCPYNDGDIAVEFITPDKAREYLANQRPNRGMKRKNLDKLSNDLSNGRFVEKNGNAIRFDRYGRMGDGQHRCKMVIDTKIGIWSIVIRNLPDKAFDTIDTGSVRSPSDIFRFNGVPNSNNAAAMVGAYIRLRERNSKDSCLSGTALLDIYRNDEASFNNAFKIGSSCYGKRPLLSQSFMSSLVYYLINDKKHPQEFVEDFCHQLFWQENVELGVIKILHDTLLDDFIRAHDNRRARITPSYKLMLVVKTWNAFVTKKDIKVLKWIENVEKPIWFM